jgi:hypothetical protein
MKIQLKNYAITFGFVLLMILIMMMGWALPAVADTPLPPRYPPRVRHGKHEKPVGAYIELRPYSQRETLWTVVQWQDKAGDWHEVEGWRGELDEGYKKVWWVAPADFNKGPFHWVIFQARGSQILATSEPFYLPHIANEIILSEVWLDQ